MRAKVSISPENYERPTRLYESSLAANKAMQLQCLQRSQQVNEMRPEVCLCIVVSLAQNSNEAN